MGLHPGSTIHAPTPTPRGFAWHGGRGTPTTTTHLYCANIHDLQNLQNFCSGCFVFHLHKIFATAPNIGGNIFLRLFLCRVQFCRAVFG